MSHRPQTGRQNVGRQFSKSAHEKKVKEKKQRQVVAKYLQEDSAEVTGKESIERALTGINRLGNQIFALSPFSQYFDDWIVNLRQVVSEFETRPLITVDSQFEKERDQIFADVEAALAENRLAESTLTEEAKALEENNHKIAEADREYAEKTREISNKRNTEIQRLSRVVLQLEDDLSAQQQVKLGFFKFKEKKQATEKLAETNHSLNAAKNELEVTTQNFKIEQEKLHDNYEQLKQELNVISDRLHKQLEKLETDTSTQVRQTACNALVQAINALIQRTTSP